MDSAYVQLLRKQKPRTLVVFSSANVPEGKFSGSRKFRDLDANILFVNCPKSSWYLKPIPGLGRTVEEISHGINELIEQTNATESVVFYGGSMGGYGATLYGAMRANTRVLATGVEFLLGIKGGYYNKECNDKTLPRDMPNVIEAVRASRSRFTYVVGEECTIDLKCVLPVTGLENVSVYSIINGEHSIPFWLDQVYGLDRIVGEMLEGRDFTKAGKYRSKILSFPVLVEHLYHFDTSGVSKEAFLSFEDALERAVDCPFSRSYYLRRKAWWLLKDNRVDHALEDLQLAVKLNGDNAKIHTLLAQCHVRMNHLGDAKKHAAIAMVRSDKKVGPICFDAFFIMLDILHKEEKRSEYREVLAKLQELLPTHGAWTERAAKYAGRLAVHTGGDHKASPAAPVQLSTNR